MAELTERHSRDKTGHSQTVLYYTRTEANIIESI